MAKYEIPVGGYTYYLETRKIRGEQGWELLSRGAEAARITEGIAPSGELRYTVEFAVGGEVTLIARDLGKAVRHLAKSHGDKLQVEAVYGESQEDAQAETPAPDGSQEPEIWAIPDLADWPDSALAENLAIYKAESPSDYVNYRIAELSAEIERRAAIESAYAESLVARGIVPPALPGVAGNATIEGLAGVGCPPLTIQFGEVGGLSLDSAPEVGSVLAAIADTLESFGHRELAEHTRKLWITGIAPLIEGK